MDAALHGVWEKHSIALHVWYHCLIYNPYIPLPLVFLNHLI